MKRISYALILLATLTGCTPSLDPQMIGSILKNHDDNIQAIATAHNSLNEKVKVIEKKVGIKPQSTPTPKPE